MEQAQSANESMLSNSCEEWNEMPLRHSHVELSSISSEVVLFRTRNDEYVPAVAGEPASRAIQASTKQKQTVGGMEPSCTSIVDYKQASDEELLAAARASDERAFSEMSGRSLQSIRNKVFRIVRNREDTEDVLQDALLKAYEHLVEFRGTSSFSTWFAKIAINSALMVLRRRRSRSEVPIDQRGCDENTWEPWEFPDPSPNPEQAYKKRQVLELVLRAINRLPPADRKVVEYHHRHDQSLQQCADAVGITVAAAKSRLLRARITIRSALEKKSVYATDARC